MFQNGLAGNGGLAGAVPGGINAGNGNQPPPPLSVGPPPLSQQPALLPGNTPPAQVTIK